MPTIVPDRGEDPKRKIIDLINKRRPYYAKADYTMDTGKLTINQVVEMVAEIVTNK
jgi:shikimate kinase